MESFDLGLWAFRVVVLVLGACVGSFLAATAWRLPRGVSLLTPSACTGCHRVLPWYGLIPVIGAFLVAFRCSHCGMKVSWHYAATEAMAAVLTLVALEVHGGSAHFFAALLAFGGWSWENAPIGILRFHSIGELGVSLWLLYTGILLSLVDFEFRILPDVVTLPGIVLGLLISAVRPHGSFVEGLVGAVAGAGTLWVIAAAYRKLRHRDGLGFGDVKYLAMIGAVLGWSGVLWTLMAASIAGSGVGILWGLVVLVSRRRHRPVGESGSDTGAQGEAEGQGWQSALTVAIPFGPFLAAGAFVYSLFEKQFLNLMMPQ